MMRNRRRIMPKLLASGILSYKGRKENRSISPGWIIFIRAIVFLVVFFFLVILNHAVNLEPFCSFSRAVSRVSLSSKQTDFWFSR